MKNAYEELKNLRDDFESWVSETMALARNAGRNKTAWAGWFRRWTGYMPEAYTSSGQAAHPSDLRVLLVRIREECLSSIDLIGRIDNLDPDDELWDFCNIILDEFVTDYTNNYIEETAVKPDIGDVFSAAISGQRSKSATKGKKAYRNRKYTIRCKGCGAPRQKGNMYDNCVFCGRPFFKGEDPY